jgi:hypothetical protein
MIMNTSTITETAKALKAAGLADEAIATMLMNMAVDPVTPDPAPAPKKKPAKTTKSLTADSIAVTEDLRSIADDTISYALAAGESDKQVKAKVCELISEAGILHCKDADEGFTAFRKLLESATTVPDKLEARNTGKITPVRFTSGPRKGQVKWTNFTELSVPYERGREFIYAFIPMRDDQGYKAAEEKLFVNGGFAAKEIIRATMNSYKAKRPVDPVKQSITNAKALKGVIDKYVTKKADAKKVKAEMFPILDEIKAMINKTLK